MRKFLAQKKPEIAEMRKEPSRSLGIAISNLSISLEE
jgi:hypothetical protein